VSGGGGQECGRQRGVAEELSSVPCHGLVYDADIARVN
jgi:hypothetical protein